MQAIEDYINGNLSDAKRRARKAGRKQLTEALIEEYGYRAETAFVIVAYLLDNGSFQEACDYEAYDKAVNERREYA